MTALGLSATGHVAAAALLLLSLAWSAGEPERMHVVNLVPAVPAIGNPAATAAVPPSRTAPPRESPPPPPSPPRATPPPEPRPVPAPSRPLALPDAPRATTPLPPRPTGLPRPSERDLPPIASAPPRALPAPSRPVEPTPESRPAPPVASGQAAGSVAGAGSLSLDVSDFPHAWYLRQVLQKVENEWQRQGLASTPPEKPLVLVEIQRDGTIRTPRIEKTSGNAFYDQAALRAIMNASPFPRLPDDWTKRELRVMFRFELRPQRG
ncbi:MAG: TonB family protein [Candidatus Rokubacteria bacterium]|nr:TonB family protein [Candidatus Rokubacteria bacterium]